MRVNCEGYWKNDNTLIRRCIDFQKSCYQDFSKEFLEQGHLNFLFNDFNM